MSRRNLIIIGLVIIIFGGLLYFFVIPKNTNNTNTVSTSENPFGDVSSNRPISTSTQAQGNQFGNGGTNLAQLTLLYKNPTSGAIFITNKNNQNILRFVDRAVGNIYQYLPETQNATPQRLTNTTIPKIQEAVWSSTGDNLVLRYLDNNTDNIVSFSAKLKISTSTTDSFGEVSGAFLSSNIKQVTINPAGDKIFEVVDKSDKSGTYGITTNIDGSGKKVVMESPISYWNIFWPKSNVVTFTTKPNYKEVGALYFFNTQTSSMTRVLGNIIGLTTLTNKDANLIAYSYTTTNSFGLDVYDVTNKISKNLKISTLSDKCVWGNSNSKILYCAVPQAIPAGNYPDAWYQGLESFNDSVWKIDTSTGAMTQIYQFGLNEASSIDAFNITISPDDQYLAFSNKVDLSLWLLQLKNN